MATLMSGNGHKGPSNPLASLAKGQSADPGSQRDRFVGSSQGASGSSLRHFPSASRGPQQQQQQQQGSPAASSGPISNWSSDFLQTRSTPSPASFDVQFSQALAQSWDQHNRHQRPPPQHHAPVPQHHHDLDSAWSNAFMTAADNGKGKGRELLVQPQNSQWDAEFSHYSAGAIGSFGYGSGHMNSAEFSRFQELGPGAGQDEERRLEEAFERSMKVAAESEAPQAAGGNDASLEATWNAAHAGAPLNNLANWEAEYSQFANGSAPSASEELLEDEERQKFFNERSEDFSSGLEDPLIGTIDDRGFPRLGEYKFEPNNAFLNHPAPLNHAQRLLSTVSSLSEATLALEAALQLPPSHPQHIASGSLEEAETWKLLGESLTMNEQEIMGMGALRRGVEAFEDLLVKQPELRDKIVPSLANASMSLSISYTNESYDLASLLTLHRHLTLLFPSQAPPLPADLAGNTQGTQTNPWTLHDSLTQAYLNIARSMQGKGEVDADVQMCLGLLFYSNSEYDKATDCWGSALSVRPRDFLLWNRLGATLANGGRSEEAVDAYRHALELNPVFTRAIYNLGVSCLNLGVYKEAAEHLLSALRMQDTQAVPISGPGGQNNDRSQNLWSTLRRSFFAMDRPDLAERAVHGADLEQFRREGFDF